MWKYEILFFRFNEFSRSTKAMSLEEQKKAKAVGMLRTTLIFPTYLKRRLEKKQLFQVEHKPHPVTGRTIVV